MQLLSRKLRDTFEVRQLWGTENHGWSNNAPWGVYHGIWNNGSGNTPTGKYTLAHWAQVRIEAQAYSLMDEDPSDQNVYVRFDLTALHNKVWTSNTTASDGFIDIGAIYLDPPNKTGFPKTHLNQLYLNNQSAALQQVENDIGGSNWVAGCIGNNGTKQGRVIPGGTWGTHVSGEDHTGASTTTVITLGADAYNADGTMKTERVRVPFYYVTRYHDEDNVDLCGTTLNPTLDLTLVSNGVSPFTYIPWGILKSGEYASCNRRDAGLQTMKNSAWGRTVICNPLNPNIPGDSYGFRRQSNRWQVSPKTPDDD